MVEAGDSLVLLERGRSQGEWFRQRQAFFVRRIYSLFFAEIRRFHRLYAAYLSSFSLPWRLEGTSQMHGVREGSEQMLDHLSAMVGSERQKGPLWQLKDLSHRVWSEDGPGSTAQGLLVDWLVGSLFHEAIKLKENIHLLSNYSSAAAAIDSLAVGRNGPARFHPTVFSCLTDGSLFIGRTGEDAARQMERMGFLFGQVNYILRMMLPDVTGNALVIRLMVEREDEVEALWGETLETLFDELFFGRAAVGFCAAGAGYFQGQWYPQALTMYRRALRLDGHCTEAIIRIAQLEAILDEHPIGRG